MKHGAVAYIYSISGLTLLFSIGFPFSYHNETYAWIPQFENINLLGAMTTHITPSANYRPFGQVVAWIFYYFNSNAYAIQVFNYALSVMAWLIMLHWANNKIVFSIIAFITTICTFSGYIYLFHLHGIFYGPILIFTAFILSRGDKHSFRCDIECFCAAMLLSLFHPFALLIYISYFMGWILENWKRLKKGEITTLLIFLIISCAIVIGIAHNRNSLEISKQLHGMLVSYKMVEVNGVVSAFAFSMVAITLVAKNILSRMTVLIFSLISSISILMYNFGLPIIFLWVLACIVKLAILYRWSVMLLLTCTALFPAITGTGSPTYTIFALMICASVVPIEWQACDNGYDKIYNLVATGSIFIVMVLYLSAKFYMPIPIFSKCISPLLAEKEKTHQLIGAISWINESQYMDMKLILHGDAPNPADSKNAIDRRHRPPTRQYHLDRYLDSRRGMRARTDDALVICFGNQFVDGLERIYKIPGKYAGDANIFIYRN